MIFDLDHGLPLREAAGVSGEGMNKVYDVLRELDLPFLSEMWARADPWTPHGALLRHQIAFTVERKLEGRW